MRRVGLCRIDLIPVLPGLIMTLREQIITLGRVMIMRRASRRLKEAGVSPWFWM